MIETEPKTRKPSTLRAPLFCYECKQEIGPRQEHFVYELKRHSYPSGTKTKLHFHYEHVPQMG